MLIQVFQLMPHASCPRLLFAALMYLCPTLLAVTWGLAWWRGDANALWSGRIADDKDHVSGSDENDVEAQDPQGSHTIEQSPHEGRQQVVGTRNMQDADSRAPERSGLLDER